MLYMFLRRFFVAPIAKLLFRPRVTGLENVPATGPALLVSNHLAFIGLGVPAGRRTAADRVPGQVGVLHRARA